MLIYPTLLPFPYILQLPNPHITLILVPSLCTPDTILYMVGGKNHVDCPYPDAKANKPITVKLRGAILIKPLLIRHATFHNVFIDINQWWVANLFIFLKFFIR